MSAIDVSPLVDVIVAQLVPVAMVGVAVLSILVMVKAFKWIRLMLLDGGGDNYGLSEYDDRWADCNFGNIRGEGDGQVSGFKPRNLH